MLMLIHQIHGVYITATIPPEETCQSLYDLDWDLIDPMDQTYYDPQRGWPHATSIPSASTLLQGLLPHARP